VRRLAATLACTALLAGCATGGPEAPSVSVMLEGVPFHPQTARHCGPAALATVLGASGVDTDPSRLAEAAFTPGRGGALQADLLSASRRHGRIAYRVEPTIDALVGELEAGRPVLVLQNLRVRFWPAWHYAVVVGVDARARELVLRSGVERERREGLSRFDATWARADRWGIVLLEPGRLPARGDVRRYLGAVTAAEPAIGPRAAILAYDAGIERWPGEAGLWFARGNAHYAAGHRALAAADFETAARLDGGFVAAWNNLASVRAEQGCAAEARSALAQGLQASQRAHGAFAAILEDTRAEVERAATQPREDCNAL